VSLREFRIWLAGSAALADRLAEVSTVERILEMPLQPAGRVDCLLVEAAWLATQPVDEVEALLSACEASGIPSILWIKESPIAPSVLDFAPSFSRTFTVDDEQLVALGAAGAREPSVLREATALWFGDESALATSNGEEGVVWLGGWRSDWPASWQDRMMSILLAAAPYRLRIHGPDDPSVLPPELRPYVASGPSRSDAEVLAAAKLTIATDPAIGSPSVVPAVAFDAIACGSAVVSPHDVGLMRAGFWALVPGRGIERDLVPPIVDGATAAGEIERLLSDRERREDAVRRSRHLVANNHTYAHRAATIASAVGRRFLPDAATRPAPA
jgi:hypothetical protein